MICHLFLCQILEGKPIHVECYGNITPLAKSGQQLIFNFYAFKENRLPFNVKVWETGLILPAIKGIVHPKIKMLSSFTPPHVIPNLFTFFSYVEHKRRYFEEF